MVGKRYYFRERDWEAPDVRGKAAPTSTLHRSMEATEIAVEHRKISNSRINKTFSLNCYFVEKH